ncbi:MAG: M20/M25/M40 family metallo-hydrolase [Thermoleophilaceae bacterium]|nr:M20/M25/M40 family metallo-hydrolase [Thermoleophilaceae bacterium]
MPERSDLERRTTELLQRLIRFDTVNPPGNEAPAQEWLRGLLEPAGFECELLAAVPGRPNLIARLRSASDGPALCLLGHVDTVLADPSEWTVDPWSGELRDGFVWGRGALDMKSQVAAESAAALALVEEGWRPEAGELMLVFTADEETGAAEGAQWLCREHPDRVRCDLVVNEGAGPVVDYDGRRVYPVCVAEKGVFRFTLTTEGRSGHASVPRIGDNALAKMAPLLTALRERRPSFDLTPEPEALLRALGVDPSDLEAALRQVEAKDPGLAVLIEPMLGVSMTPTIIRAGEKINVIPSSAELQVDCRVPPDQGREHVMRAVAEVLGEDGYGLEFACDVVGNRSPMNTPLMDSIRRFIELEDPGAAVAPMAMPGFSDSHWWRAAFPDCVAYGFFPQRAMGAVEEYSLIHAADERVPVEDLGLAASFYSDLVMETLR